MENHLPILCCTDSCTDIGKIVEKYNCDRYVQQGDTQTLESSDKELREMMGNNSFYMLKVVTL